MRQPDVSVIVLTYNQEDTIARAIDSILAQQAGEYSFEIVIGDDASTDSTRHICEEYASRYPEVVRLMPEAPNKGVVANYFDTLQACRGRYIADCAGDDYWIDADKLQRQARMLDANADVVAIHGAWREVAPDGSLRRHCVPSLMGSEAAIVGGKTLIESLLSHSRPLTLHLSTAMFRASAAFEAIAENHDMVVNPDFGCEDLPLTAALMARGRIAYHPFEVLAYTVGSHTVSNPEKISAALEYYSATVRCTARLAGFYGVKSPGLDRYFSSRAVFLAKLARHVGTAEARHTVRQTVAATGRRMPLLAVLILICARIRV